MGAGHPHTTVKRPNLNVTLWKEGTRGGWSSVARKPRVGSPVIQWPVAT